MDDRRSPTRRLTHLWVCLALLTVLGLGLAGPAPAASGRSEAVRGSLDVAPAPLALSPLIEDFLSSLAPAVGPAAGRATVGSAPLVPRGALTLAEVPADQRLSIAVALAPRDPVALAQAATAIATPGDPSYRHYLSVATFRQRYGATPGAVAAVTHALTADGLSVTAPSANGLAVDVTGSAARLAAAFATPLEQIRLPGGRIAISNLLAPSLPTGLARDVQAVIGLSDVFTNQGTALAPTRAISAAAAGTGVSRAAPRRSAADVGPADPALASCAAAATTAREATSGGGSANPPPDGTAYTGQQIAAAYDFDPLYDHGDEGQGQTVGVLELEGNFPNDLTAFESCYGIHAPISYTTVDGGPPAASAAASNGLETELDVENILELAPRASVEIYQAPNTANGSYDAFDALLSGGHIDVLSTSWDECETLRGSNAAAAENSLFQEAATQGTSIYAAAGDFGAEACDAIGDVNLPLAATVDPASQPYVTGVGGTNLESIGAAPATKPDETVWDVGGVNAALGVLGAVASGAGGGGLSLLWHMPAYQQSAPSGLGVEYGESSSTVCGSGSGNCREIPDVSADADDYSGYVVYWDGTWTTVGGTSGAAPLWAALTADADASGGCAAHGRVGFANPALYRIAGGPDYDVAFNDIRAGDNDLDDLNGGKFQAKSAYDMASGLGSPVAAELVPALCGGAAPKVTCAATLSVPLHPGHGLRITAAIVEIDGRRQRVVRGHAVTSVTVRPGNATTFTVTIVATLSNHERIAYTTRFSGCRDRRTTAKVLKRA